MSLYDAPSVSDQTGKASFATGANTGIGYEAARAPREVGQFSLVLAGARRQNPRPRGLGKGVAMRGFTSVTIFVGLVGLLLVPVASSACCRLVKIDDEMSSSQILACEPDASGGCGELIFAGTLAIGEEQVVCASTGRIVYQEYDEALADYQPPVEAVCDDNDVEL